MSESALLLTGLTLALTPPIEVGKMVKWSNPIPFRIVHIVTASEAAAIAAVIFSKRFDHILRILNLGCKNITSYGHKIELGFTFYEAASRRYIPLIADTPGPNDVPVCWNGDLEVKVAELYCVTRGAALTTGDQLDFTGLYRVEV